ncbi:MAG TPA: hypothetical protein ACQGQI_08505, partial [Xylella sp.]
RRMGRSAQAVGAPVSAACGKACRSTREFGDRIMITSVPRTGPSSPALTAATPADRSSPTTGI